MIKITFLGAGSTVFARSVLGDCMLCESLKGSEIALYDIDPQRLKESEMLICALRDRDDPTATVKTYCGAENRKEALRSADFVVNAIQVGGYEPCTVTDFEIPKKYGLRQTIGDTLGIGGIMRTLRTIPVMEGFARDIEEVCPDAWFLNYVNPMAMLTGYMQRYTGVKTIGLCHSVQVCTKSLFHSLRIGDPPEGYKEKIAGINHMAWLLEIRDKDGNDLYPMIREKTTDFFAHLDREPNHQNRVRLDYIRRLGYYCTESSEHNAEYNMFYIKSKYPELIEAYKIPLDEYPRRCVEQIENWKKRSEQIAQLGSPDFAPDEGFKAFFAPHRSKEYASRIMEAMVTGTPYQIGGNVLNKGHLITNLPEEACVEVPCLVNGMGIHPCHVGALPPQLAAMNMTNINVQLLTIEAARTLKKEHIYHAAMLDPHTASELSIDDIVKMVDELIAAHGDWLPKFH